MTDEDDDVRIVVHGKSNLGELQPSQAFQLSKAGGFKWLGECDVTLDELLYSKPSGKRGRKMEAAASFLMDTLSDGNAPATIVYEQAELAGISKITLERAKTAAGVKSSRVDGRWIWGLTDN
jgi:hypothetical protein